MPGLQDDVSPAGFRHLPVPERVVLPLEFSLGKVNPVVEPGQQIRAGEYVGRDENQMIPPVRASVSGVVTEITPWPSADGQKLLSVVIEANGDEEVVRLPLNGNGESKPESLLRRIAEAGIREVDAYAWPLAVRLAQPSLTPPILLPFAPALRKPVRYLIINGMDRQPGVSVRRNAILAEEKELLESVPLLKQITAAETTLITIYKDQKLPADFERKVSSLGAELLKCPRTYPLALKQGLIPYVTGEKLPGPNDDARSVGAVMLDVTTAQRIAAACKEGYPAVETSVEIIEPARGATTHVKVREGTLLEDLLAQLPDRPQNPAKTIIGGPFLGYAQYQFRIPLTQQTDSVVFQSKDELTHFVNAPCMNCGFCVRHCPMGLMPGDLSRLCEYGHFEAAEKAGLFHCIECGICSYVCPAQRPMVQLLRFGKSEMLAVQEAS